MTPKILLVKRVKKVSSARKGKGFMPVITRDPERMMNSVPSVVMNEGMLNLSVMKPLTRPTTTAVARAHRTAMASGTPWIHASTIM